MTEGSRWSARALVRGLAEGPAMVSGTALSFLGDLDIRTGRVVGASSDLAGRVVAGRVLVLPETRGSAGAWRFLYQLKVHGTHPAALVLRTLPDPSVVQGAILSEVPVVMPSDAGFWDAIRDGEILRVDGDAACVAQNSNG
ncbi:aconitase X swivel domain-containing protein [Salipiger mucosus]|uniref:Phosphomevalonate dehydratase small subunit-like domain-containing protein n=1 Tax=Salipiger mucosus DSM 16094 TaxID=1123237 RepID=S9R183_9RHOB|nr:DUF126 domain-containing protein [Salipiger mucosus]EPX85642.1 hypothetical protein Salmuc_04914 [Salipiger mucosus DSM 16094]